jgi:hypothetical protein
MKIKFNPILKENILNSFKKIKKIFWFLKSKNKISLNNYSNKNFFIFNFWLKKSNF